MNVITIINNPYLIIKNVSLNLTNGNRESITIYGTASLTDKYSDNNMSPTIALDVINANDNIVYCERMKLFDNVVTYESIENSFKITFIDYMRFFRLPVREFRLYSILEEKNYKNFN